MSTALDLDVVCIGETLVDFLPERPGLPVREVPKWVPCSGGSPANVAVGLARLGARSAMLGVIGADEFGDFLLEHLAEEGVDVTHLRQSDEGKTGLVFISLDDKGERSFSFYRTRAAELFLADRDVDGSFLARAKAIHLGTNSLVFRDAQRAAIRMAELAKAEGKIVCCDPNLRLHLWPDPRELRGVLDRLLPGCTVVKLSEDELEFATGTTDPDKAIDYLTKLRVALPIITLGPKGAVFAWQDKRVRVPAPKATVLDTTGAGDGFVSALLFGLTRLWSDAGELRSAGVGELREIATFACGVGTKVVEKLGAVAGLPSAAEIQIPSLLRR